MLSKIKVIFEWFDIFRGWKKPPEIFWFFDFDFEFRKGISIIHIRVLRIVLQTFCGKKKINFYVSYQYWKLSFRFIRLHERTKSTQAFNRLIIISMLYKMLCIQTAQHLIIPKHMFKTVRTKEHIITKLWKNLRKTDLRFFTVRP